MVALVAFAASCAGSHKGPRTLAAIGATLAVGGSATWVAGERFEQRGLTNAGFVAVVGGIAAVVAAGGWMALVVACRADPDCPDEQQCNEIPAPPGGIPYKQCMPR
ncbi:MAG TPA: hypothetical protein VFH73_17065 [Polyangia bacterium]|nr:hypothetical protein [Polyangia bacterium]